MINAAQRPTPTPSQVYNSNVLDKLPPASQGDIKAVLVVFKLDGTAEQPAWEFLVNPRALAYRNSANYSLVATLAASAEQQQFNYTTGRSLTIADLLFETWCQGKSLRPLLEGLEALLRAKVEDKQFAPPLLRFRFGTESFGPCVLTEIDYQISRWLGGEPARARVSMTLKEIPKPLTPAEAEAQAKERAEAFSAAQEAQGNPPLALTERQQEEAVKAAKEYLIKHQALWSADVQAAIKSGKYKLECDPKTGAVSMVGASAAKLGVLIKYDGTTATAGVGVTTVAVKTGVKPPELKLVVNAKKPVEPGKSATPQMMM